MPPLLDADHRGPLVNLAAWITLVPLISFTLVKVSTKWNMTKNLQMDDAYMAMGMFFAIAQVITTVIQVNSGLGQHKQGLAVDQFEAYQKATWVSQMFYVIVIACGKLGSLQFLLTLTQEGVQRIVLKQTMNFIVLWLITCIFCIAFQCSIPNTWDLDTGKCFDQIAFWIFNATVDIITQLLIGLSPIYLLYNIQMDSSRKRVAMLSFSPNITTIPLIIFRLIFLSRSISSEDLTFSTFDTALISELHTNYSLIASCIPFLRPLMNSLDVGLIDNEITVAVLDGTASCNASTPKEEKLNNFSRLPGRRNLTSKSKTAYSSTSRSRSKITVPGSTFISTITASRKGDDMELDERKRRDSYGSQERMVINQVRTTMITSEPAFQN